MADLTVKTVDDEQKFVYEKTIEAAGLHQVNFETENSFLDKDINIQITTPAAPAPTLDVTDITGSMVMGTASDGVYEPTATISGNVSVATAGWMTTGNKAVSESGVKIGTVNQSVLKNGNTAIASGAEITPSAEDQTINITEGYNTARTVVVKAASEMDPATVSSGNATITELTYTADTTNHTFDISATETIPAPGVNTAGYISSTKGTKNTGTATVNATVDQVKVGVTASDATKKVTPVIARTAKPSGDAWVDAASGSAVTAKPSSGAYVRVDAPAVPATVTATGKVSAAGYGTTAAYQADSATSINVGSNAAASAYVPITAGKVSSGSTTIGSVGINYNSSSSMFDVTGNGTVPAPVVNTAGYVGNGIGTLTSAPVSLDAKIAKIGIEATISGTGTMKPIIQRTGETNVAASAATTTKPTAGFYVAVVSPANTSAVSAAASVTSPGYGNTTAGQYTTKGSSLSVGAAASDVTYVPITAASFDNSATAGHTYTDISSTAPILISDDYLYINKGYTNDVKISLAKLVPDDATITASTGAAYMLNGQSAYDSNGKLVVGSIPTYAGAYTVA